MAILSKSEFPLPEVEQAEIIRIFIELLRKGATTDSCETEISVPTPIHPPKKVDELRSQWAVDWGRLLSSGSGLWGEIVARMTHVPIAGRVAEMLWPS
jgi:hypothetical protein